MEIKKPPLLRPHQFKVMKGNILYPVLMKLVTLTKFPKTLCLFCPVLYYRQDVQEKSRKK